MSAACKGCGAAIVWGVTTPRGKRVPLNANAERRYIPCGKDDQGNQLVRLDVVYVPHHSTCPAVAQFRKPQ